MSQVRRREEKEEKREWRRGGGWCKVCVDLLYSGPLLLTEKKEEKEEKGDIKSNFQMYTLTHIKAVDREG